MWACPYCMTKIKQVVCCNRVLCEDSTSRFKFIDDFWNHLEIKHQKEYKQLTKLANK